MVSPLLLVAFQFQTWAESYDLALLSDGPLKMYELIIGLNREDLSGTIWTTLLLFWLNAASDQANEGQSPRFLTKKSAANVMECQNCCFVCGSGTSFCEILVAEYSWGIHGKACCCSWTGLHEISWINTDTNSKFTAKLKSRTLSVYESPGFPWLRTSVSMIFRVQCPSMSVNVPVFPCSSWGSCIFAIVAVSCSDALGPASEIWQSNIPLCFWIEIELVFCSSAYKAQPTNQITPERYTFGYRYVISVDEYTA